MVSHFGNFIVCCVSPCWVKNWYHSWRQNVDMEQPIFNFCLKCGEKFSLKQSIHFILSQWHSFILRLCAKLSGCWVGKLFLVHSNARWQLDYQQPVSEWVFVSPHTKPYFKQVCLCVSQVIFTLAWLIACRLSLQYLWQAEKYPLKVSQINPV